MQIFKVERNDPCLCGSGRKYKKCCLSRVENAARLLQKAVGQGITPAGRQILFALALICGLNIREDAVSPDPERLGRLLREVWDEEDEVASTETGIVLVGSKFMELLREKQQLKQLRLPVDLLQEIEEVTKANEDEAGEFLLGVMAMLNKSRGFIFDAFYNIADSLYDDPYSDAELKTLLSGLGWLVDDASRYIFTKSVIQVTLQELEEAEEQVKAILEDPEMSDMARDQQILELVSRYRNYGEYVYARLISRGRSFLYAVKDGKIKLNLPFYAMAQGFYGFAGRILGCLPQIMGEVLSGALHEALGETLDETETLSEIPLGETSREGDAFGFFYDYQDLSEILWEGKESEYFLPVLIQKLLGGEIDTGEDKELAEGRDALAMALRLGILLDKTNLIEVFYLTALNEFIRNLQGGQHLTGTAVSNLEDLFDEQVMARYVEGLKKEGKEKEADYVWEQFKLFSPRLREQYEAVSNSWERLIQQRSMEEVAREVAREGKGS